MRPPDHGTPHRQRWLLHVEGHAFEVGRRAASPTTYDVERLSGPHPYGFASSRPAEWSVAEMEESIRAFLGQIDPETGYLA